MKHKLLATTLAFGLAGFASAQDAKTVLQKAAAALGTAKARA